MQNAEENAPDMIARQGQPSRVDLVSRAASLQGLLDEQAAQMDEQRRITDDVNAALVDAGMFRLWKPARLGGFETDLRTLVQVIERLGEADGSTAWVVALTAGASRLTGMISPQAQDEVFGVDPDARVAGSSTPGLAQRVDGGLRLSGRWEYASGSADATWACLAAHEFTDQGAIRDSVIGIVPAAMLLRNVTWNSVGMRASSSDTWIGENIFVPDYMTISTADRFGGLWNSVSPKAMYRLAFTESASLLHLAPMLGLARAALELTTAKSRGWRSQERCATGRGESYDVQAQLAEAAMKIKTARLHGYDAADVLDATASDGAQIGDDVAAEILAQVGYSAQLVLEAFQALMNIYGVSCFAESNRMQHYWRDASTIARHPLLRMTAAFQIYAKTLLRSEC
jgi:3-hydroxy-9,10-secoandrosta-1,3,5(10)-triene-9,17-dione monooxygenase